MKKIITRILLLSLIILVLQMTLTYYNFQYESPGTIRKLDKYLTNNIDIIYFGDSTIRYTSLKDTNKQSMSEMLDSMLNTYTVRSVDHNAYHMDIYFPLIKYISEHNHPKAIVIPINMATFSPCYDMKPSFQFETEKIFIQYYNNYLFRIFYKPLLIFKAFNIDTISSDEFMNTPVYNGDKKICSVKDMEFQIEKRTMKNIIIYYYMYPLIKAHRKIDSMMEIIRLTKKNNIKLIFYFTPLNYKICEKYLGNEFRIRIKNNTNIIKSLLSDKGIGFLDLIFDLPSESFCWIDDGCLNEHLNEKGRKYVAESLNKWLSNNL